MKFEDMVFVVPAHPDVYLKQLYGDYMTPPPDDQHYLNHDVLFCSLTGEYQPGGTNVTESGLD